MYAQRFMEHAAGRCGGKGYSGPPASDRAVAESIPFLLEIRSAAPMGFSSRVYVPIRLWRHPSKIDLHIPMESSGQVFPQDRRSSARPYQRIALMRPIGPIEPGSDVPEGSPPESGAEPDTP